jgi:hypothetical protein
MFTPDMLRSFKGHMSPLIRYQLVICPPASVELSIQQKLEEDVYRKFNGRSSMWNFDTMSEDDVGSFVRLFSEESIIPFLGSAARDLSAKVAQNKKSIGNKIRSWFNSKGKTKEEEVREEEESIYAVKRFGDVLFYLREYELALATWRSVLGDAKANERVYASIQESCLLASLFLFDSQQAGGSPSVEGFDAKIFIDQSADSALRHYERVGLVSCMQRVLLLHSISLARRDINKATESFLKLGSATVQSQAVYVAIGLEQVSYLQAGRHRKVNFYLVLAGYRYASVGAKYHALRCYRAFGERRWRLVRDHLDTTLSRLHMSVGEYKDAVCRSMSSLAEAKDERHWKEFLSTLEQYGQPVIDCPVPAISIRGTTSADAGLAAGGKDYDALINSLLTRTKRRKSIYSHNVVARGETLTVAVEFTNPVAGLPITLRNLRMKLTGDLQSTTVPSVTIDGASTKVVDIPIFMDRDGEFIMTTIEYEIDGLPNVPFRVPCKDTKEKITVSVKDEMPLLRTSLDLRSPDNMLFGEIREGYLVLENKGTTEASNIMLQTTHPECFYLLYNAPVEEVTDSLDDLLRLVDPVDPSVTVLDGLVLPPRGVVRIPIRVRAARLGAVHVYNAIFYEKSQKSRFATFPLLLNVDPFLSASAVISPSATEPFRFSVRLDMRNDCGQIPCPPVSIHRIEPLSRSFSVALNEFPHVIGGSESCAVYGVVTRETSDTSSPIRLPSARTQIDLRFLLRDSSSKSILASILESSSKDKGPADMPAFPPRRDAKKKRRRPLPDRLSYQNNIFLYPFLRQDAISFAISYSTTVSGTTVLCNAYLLDVPLSEACPIVGTYRLPDANTVDFTVTNYSSYLMHRVSIAVKPSLQFLVKGITKLDAVPVGPMSSTRLSVQLSCVREAWIDVNFFSVSWLPRLAEKTDRRDTLLLIDEEDVGEAKEALEKRSDVAVSVGGGNLWWTCIDRSHLPLLINTVDI